MKEVFCEICGSKFTTVTTGKFCSEKCKKIKKSFHNKKYHSENIEIINNNRKKHYEKNKDWYRERDGKRVFTKRIENPNRPIRRNLSKLTEEEKNIEIKIKINTRKRKKYHSDELYNLQTRYRSLLNKKLRNDHMIKDSSSLEYLGCSWKNFKKHIESQFKGGMNWDNRKMWDIDHIIPISSAKTKEEIIKLSNFKNLQPMWKIENIKKSNKFKKKE